jgi:hypothetical protein
MIVFWGALMGLSAKGMLQLPTFTDPIALLAIKFLHIITIQSSLSPHSSVYKTYTKERNQQYEQIRRLLKTKSTANQSFTVSPELTKIFIAYLEHTTKYQKVHAEHLKNLLIAYDMPNIDVSSSKVLSKIVQSLEKDPQDHQWIATNAWPVMAFDEPYLLLDSILAVLLLRRTTRPQAWHFFELFWQQNENLDRAKKKRALIPVLFTTLNRICPLRVLMAYSDELITRLPNYQRKELWIEWLVIAQQESRGTRKEPLMQQFRSQVFAEIAQKAVSKELFAQLAKPQRCDVDLAYYL